MNSRLLMCLGLGVSLAILASYYSWQAGWTVLGFRGIAIILIYGCVGSIALFLAATWAAKFHDPEKDEAEKVTKEGHYRLVWPRLTRHTKDK